MNVFVDGVGQVVVDDVTHVRNIQASGSNSSRDLNPKKIINLKLFFLLNVDSNLSLEIYIYCYLSAYYFFLLHTH